MNLDDTLDRIEARPPGRDRVDAWVGELVELNLEPDTIALEVRGHCERLAAALTASEQVDLALLCVQALSRLTGSLT